MIVKKETNYMAPEIEMILVRIEGVIATSGATESYENGSTDGWYDNE